VSLVRHGSVRPSSPQASQAALNRLAVSFAYIAMRAQRPQILRPCFSSFGKRPDMIDMQVAVRIYRGAVSAQSAAKAVPF